MKNTLKYKHFCKDQRNELSILLKKGYSQRDIAKALGRNPSSISREIKENSVLGQYNPDKANGRALAKRSNSKYQGMKVKNNAEVEAYIREKIKLSWSPEAVAGRLEIDTNGRLLIHHSAIYKYLYSSYGQSLCQYLRYKRCRRKRRKAVKSKQEIIKNRVFIENRPKIINQRKRFFDFEADVLGAPRYFKEKIIGCIDRKSRYILAKKVERLKYAMDGFKDLLKLIPINSVTFDNGPENARHLELNTDTFFCHPYSAWEKGSIENAFGLLREYIPKRADLRDYSDNDISAIVEVINNRPRRCLSFRTPKEVFEEQLVNK